LRATPSILPRGGLSRRDRRGERSMSLHLTFVTYNARFRLPKGSAVNFDVCLRVIHELGVAYDSPKLN
jgi:hypothetical protein